MSSSILLKRSKTLANLVLLSRCQTRAMGGGPRTFPGGVSKWQWKRMHEKRARDKERALLAQERQLYHARIRSQIRAGFAGNPDPFSPHPGGGPMSPAQHLKALADRFFKEGAEDLWNERDGPIESGEVSVPSRSPVDSPKNGGNQNGCVNKTRVAIRNRFGVRSYSSFSMEGSESSKLVRNNDDLNGERVSLSGCVKARVYGSNAASLIRSYSSYSKAFRPSFVKEEGESSKLERSSSVDSGKRKAFPWSFVGDGCESSKFERKPSAVRGRGLGKRKGSSGRRGRRFGRNESSDDDDYDESEEESVSGKWDVRRMGSSAALGKFDEKVTRRRVSVKEYKGDISDQIEVIRHEISQKRLIEAEEKNEVDEDSFISEKRFDELEISPLTIKSLSLAGFDKMTRVQEAALSVALQGKDALVKAKNGTGKTLAFLIPAIETVLSALSNDPGGHRATPIRVLVLCPTRELASQIAAETNVLLKYHDGLGVQTLVGGIRLKDDQKRLESGPSQIIVATTGRLLDHIENKSGISVRLMGLKMLILDEAARLLDLGFRNDIEKIADCLPRERQTMLFSATVPKEVRRISQVLLKREHAFINTFELGDPETVSRVKQSYLIAPHEFQFQIVHHLLMDHISQSPDYKVIIFCSTAMLTSLMYLLLSEMKMNVREIQTRKPQLFRNRVTDEFRESKRLILVTSDVMSHGINFPDVTLVMQVGVPISRDQYIHRLGRTGREGRIGEGVLLLAPWEEYFLQDLTDLPLEKFRLTALDPDAKLKIEACMSKIEGSVKEAAYRSWLGYYNSIREIGRDKTSLVKAANVFCKSIGLEEPPGLFRRTAVKMGLRNVPGMKINRDQGGQK